MVDKTMPARKFKITKVVGDEMYGSVVTYELYVEVDATVMGFQCKQWQMIATSNDYNELRQNARKFVPVDKEETKFPELFYQ